MSRQRAGINQPEKFAFTASSLSSQYLRRYCFENNLQIGQALNEALIDYILKSGYTGSRESLEDQEGADK